MHQKYTETLGPIFLYWISQLHDKLAFLSDTQGRKALYCTRAGKRIADLMQAYAGDDTSFDSELFGISRIAACKVSAARPENFLTAHRITSETLQHVTLADLCRAYLQHEWDETNPHMKALGRLKQPYTQDSFRVLLAANDPASRFFRERLVASRAGLTTWLKSHLKSGTDKRNNTGYVLVDSGWKGSIQRALQEVYPEYGFEGVYFGASDSEYLPGRYGIVFDSTDYIPARPETIFALHRHLVETLLEPNAPSVEELADGPNDAIARAQIIAVRNEDVDPSKDALFIAVRNYIADNAKLNPDKILSEYRKALKLLVPMILTPSRKDALVLAGKSRSIDFGRSGEVPVLLGCKNEGTVESRIQRSLWPQGQIALEYDRHRAKEKQLLISNGERSSYFSAHETAQLSKRAAAAAQGKPAHWSGSVAIVTRTKNRPLLLKRAARSVANQTWSNIQWVVVNDGGDPGPVESIIESCGVESNRITLINNKKSVGMEAASNMGVRSVDTEFVVIHDDDDAWEPAFLRSSIDFLRSSRAAAAGFEGVVSRAWRVSEQISGDSVIIHGKEPYMPWVSEVPIAQMAVGNFFAPISFLYRRWVYEDIGGYDESLPVLGDWRFNLDFLIRGNIGLLDEYLSFYHHRDKGDSNKEGVYANSIVGGQSLHQQYFSVVTNAIIRDPDTSDGLRMLVSNAHLQRVMEQNFHSTRDGVNQLSQRLDYHFGASWRNQQALLKKAYRFQARPGLDKSDQLHIIQHVTAGKFGRAYSLPLRLALNSVRPMHPKVRRSLLKRVLHSIPSPASFDHIAYLGEHPELWETKYNGSDQYIPYHHYILKGVDLGFRRPSV